ncbi:hypothetical protein ACM26V_07345 [Salipaludibacillus sp. HK11]|uniref:hypothetical protein n=1 Tax=Salipaludibacillus sp. HK11 TaxID=3394320 RepID=UPI0039FDAFAD
MKRQYNPFDQQLKNIQSETNNPAIFDDVVRNDLDQYSGGSQLYGNNGPLTRVEEESVKNHVDGKTWSTLKR